MEQKIDGSKKSDHFVYRIMDCATVSEARLVCQEIGLVPPPTTPHTGSFYHPRQQQFLQKVALRGGTSNCHGHADRAYTLEEMIKTYGPDVFERPMIEKWEMTKALERASTPAMYLGRILKYVFESIDHGTTYICTNIDADPSSGMRATEAAVIVRNLFERNLPTDPNFSVDFRHGPHPHEGFFTEGNLDMSKVQLFESAAAMGNFCGGLPSRDGRLGGPDEANFNAHLDIVLQTAKNIGKNCGIHVDQSNSIYEVETLCLLDKMREHGMQNRVVGVHAVTLARKTPEELANIIVQMKEVGFGLIVCPTAAISMKAPNENSPTGPSLAPIVTLIKAGIPCFAGGDNRADIYNPDSDGDIIAEAKFARETLRSYDNETFAAWATAVPFAINPFEPTREGFNKRAAIEAKLAKSNNSFSHLRQC